MEKKLRDKILAVLAKLRGQNLHIVLSEGSLDLPEASIKYLATGGTADIFLAEMDGLRFVIKRFKEQFKTPRMREVLKNEARILQQADHPNIVKILNVVDTEEEFAFILEYIEGEDLERVLDNLRRQKAYPPIEAGAFLFYTIAEVLDYLHRNELAHRDLSGGNIIIRDDKTTYPPVLIDFSLGKAEGRPGASKIAPIFGQSRFLPPDVLYLNTPVTKSVDVYALGVNVYSFLSGGHHPLGDSSEEREKNRLGHHRIIPLSMYRKEFREDPRAKKLENLINVTLLPLEDLRLRPAEIKENLLSIFTAQEMRKAYIEFFSNYYSRKLEPYSRGEQIRAEVPGKEKKQKTRLFELLRKKQKKSPKVSTGFMQKKKRMRIGLLVAGGAIFAAILAFLALSGGSESGKFETLTTPSSSTGTSEPSAMEGLLKEDNQTASPAPAGVVEEYEVRGYLVSNGKTIKIIKPDGKTLIFPLPPENKGKPFGIVFVKKH